MAKINLLPWREELRKQQLQEFVIVLVMVVLAAGLAAFFWQWTAKNAVEDQNKRNVYIEQQIGLMEENIKEIDELQKRRDGLIERMNVIQSLQGNRPVIVHVFDQLVSTLPDGVYYREVIQRGDKFEISGIAESNNRVSNLMRSLDSSPWLKNPQLNKVAANGEQFEFSLTIDLDSNPLTATAPAAGAPAAAASPTTAPAAAPPAAQ
ncbi:MAG: PilN domain-containing protein [Pseudomonadota bacterium]